MEYRRLGKSDVNASVVTFGAWAIGGTSWGGADDAAAVDGMRAGFDVGMTSVDTAAVYGWGKSEELVGQAIQGRRAHVQVFTKFGLRWDRDEGEHFFTLQEGGSTYAVYRNARKQSVIEECEASLKRLGTDYIDLYQCHWRDHTTPVEETMEALAYLEQRGMIRAGGVSNFNVEELAACQAVFPLASDQPPYSMLRRDIEADVLPFCREHLISVVCYSPLQRGVLTGKFHPGHEFKDGDSRAGEHYFRPENLRRINAFLEALRPIADGYGVTIPQVVVNWTIQQPGITVALVGARNAEQARENAKAGEFMLSPEDLARIDGELANLELT